MVQGTKLGESKCKESIVHIRSQKYCLKKESFRLRQVEIHSTYICSKNEITAPEKDNEINFLKHIVNKRNYIK